MTEVCVETCLINLKVLSFSLMFLVSFQEPKIIILDVRDLTSFYFRGKVPKIDHASCMSSFALNERHVDLNKRHEVSSHCSRLFEGHEVSS